MKHYKDIENLREFDEDLGNGVTRRSNANTFEVGDHVQITEKIDGSNASWRFNNETGQLDSFSRKRELGFNSTLNGFWNYVQSLPIEEYADEPNHIYFGEWTGAKNKIVYDKDKTGKLYLFDVYDTETEQYLPQDEVNKLIEKHGLCRANILYDGEFKSWDHVREFCHSPAYGEIQEGVVIRDLDKLNSDDCRNPYYLKIVNTEFKERMKQKDGKKKRENSEEYAKAQELIESIVTHNRVEKEIIKMRDEDLVPSELTPKDMWLIAKLLPKRIYDDCMKEESETVIAAGEYGGKIIQSITMKIAREVVLG